MKEREAARDKHPIPPLPETPRTPASVQPYGSAEQERVSATHSDRESPWFSRQDQGPARVITTLSSAGTTSGEFGG